jgi:hypothetical protein
VSDTGLYVESVVKLVILGRQKLPLRYEWGMTDSIRVRVAARRADDTAEETYLADVSIGVDRPFFESLIGVLDRVDPKGKTYPLGPRSNRSSEPYVRTLGRLDEPAVPTYGSLNRVWAIREHQGTLASWGFFDRRELLIADILRATDAGYNTQDFRDVIIRGEAGIGGDFFHYDWASFLGGLGIGLATGYTQSALTAVGSKLGMIVRTKRDDAKLAVVAKLWQQRGISSPYVLREWIDQQKAIGSSEVATRLQIRVEDAKKLLSALGYEPARGVEDHFIRSHRKKALKRRREWLEQETTAGIDAW